MQDNRHSLNDDEWERLREIEDELTRDDPSLAVALADPDRHAGSGRVIRLFSRGRVAIGVSVGAVMIAVGLVVRSPVVGAIGFAVMVGAASRLRFDALIDRARAFAGLDEPHQDEHQRKDDPR